MLLILRQFMYTFFIAKLKIKKGASKLYKIFFFCFYKCIIINDLIYGYAVIISIDFLRSLFNLLFLPNLFASILKAESTKFSDVLLKLV